MWQAALMLSFHVTIPLKEAPSFSGVYTLRFILWFYNLNLEYNSMPVPLIIEMVYWVSVLMFMINHRRAWYYGSPRHYINDNLPIRLELYYA